MSFKSSIFFLLLTFLPIVLCAQQVAIVRNTAGAEIDTLSAYLKDMDIDSVMIYDLAELDADTLSRYTLVIWDDMGFSGGGFNDDDVLALNELYHRKVNLYFIGDDLAFSSTYVLNSIADSLWARLLRLTTTLNVSGAQTIVIADSIHPVMNGPFGRVFDFPAHQDVDPALAVNLGEKILAKTDNGFDVIIAFQDSVSGVRTISQNTLALKAGDSSGQVERKKLFKNAVNWLLSGPTTSVRNEHMDFPTDIDLAQNYPNPFNPVTTIPYRLSAVSKAELSIFNVLGQKVAILVNERQQAGQYRVQWDASDFPSGVYFCRLITNTGFIQTRNLILLK